MPETTALYSVAQIRAIEQAAMTGLTPGTLMQRAGQAAAHAALGLISDMQSGSQVLVIAGPGNNGGDALEAAARLAESGMEVSVLLFSDPARQSADAQQALTHARNSNARFLDPVQLSDIASIPWSLVIDGLFGIGLMRPITGTQRALIEIVNDLPCPVLALDTPSGLDADSGTIIGPDGIALCATHTITFIGDKSGLHTAYGRDYAGEVQVASLGIDEKFFPASNAQLNRIELFARAFVRRLHNSHKGSHGDVAVIGGAHGMAGAAILAARAAAKCGAGRVFAGFVEQPPAYDSPQPELMCRLASDLDLSKAALVIGPGLGISRAAHDLLARALNTSSSMVIDADGLNLISAEPGLQHKLTQRRGSTLLTPHPLEAARLLAISNAEIQSDRVAAARELSRRFHATVVLKGSGTIVARPDGEIVINTTGNPGLATAGTGDVLAGICGALLAQHWPAWEAALAAVWLHGNAADVLVEQGIGPIGLTAGELIPCVRANLNRLISQHARRFAAR
ncbi:MAG: bifunctional ADP-dependent (S)-NAD(P)H-hydrate dehydratase/NAD(P)H-hydrate epimerase [Burkholderiales bacterium RIFCSPLOWO2_02_FULL_57_36]|nr:MAG: bifunctional ADP-dependent (S)-NAD(P)H-hydrate dehydratase/NAD(P)H-hydrate epimerase [Burkholderiales bacterium RIFCSPLOWO2_02_FULL_57_36]